MDQADKPHIEHSAGRMQEDLATFDRAAPLLWATVSYLQSTIANSLSPVTLQTHLHKVFLQDQFHPIYSKLLLKDIFCKVL